MKIWDASWHTARLCALETYMDCPYYEQLQYIGDTRIQALISLYVAGDDRLVRYAIHQFNAALQPMGLTKSSHPSRGIQIIPPFSLIYIGMVHDYFMLRNDSSFVMQFLPGIRFILDWFIGKIDSTGMLGPLPYWNHIDGGTREFPAGSPPGIPGGHSAHMSLLLALAIREAAHMFQHYGYQCFAEYYTLFADRLAGATYRMCFDSSRKLLAETPEKDLFSQHTNALAILAGILPREESRTVAQEILSNEKMAQASLYFTFYIFQALKKAGFGNEVISRIRMKWQPFIDAGLTTFPEHGIESRSDCHAWAAHPLYDLLNIVCGIESASPGFLKVIISSYPGFLTHFEGKLYHPCGMIRIKFEKNKSGKNWFLLELPQGITGLLRWNNQEFDISAGSSFFTLE